jgi:hypothetical protein
VPEHEGSAGAGGRQQRALALVERDERDLPAQQLADAPVDRDLADRERDVPVVVVARVCRRMQRLKVRARRPI